MKGCDPADIVSCACMFVHSEPIHELALQFWTRDGIRQRLNAGHSSSRSSLSAVLFDRFAHTAVPRPHIVFVRAMSTPFSRAKAPLLENEQEGASYGFQRDELAGPSTGNSGSSGIRASATFSLLDGSHPRDKVYSLFGFQIPRWCLLVFAVAVLVCLQECSDDFATKAQEVQELAFFSHGVDCQVAPNAGSEECRSAQNADAAMDSVRDNIGSIIAFLLTPALGHLSDCFGRKPLLILGAAIVLVHRVLLLLRYLLSLNLFFSYAFTALTAFDITAASAMAIDVLPLSSPPSRKSLVLGCIAAGTILSDTVLPQISKRAISTPVAFWGSTIGAAFCVLYALCLPESLERKDRRPFLWRNLNPLWVFSLMMRYVEFLMGGVFFFVLGFTFAATTDLFEFSLTNHFVVTADFMVDLETVNNCAGIVISLVLLPLAMRYLRVQTAFVAAMACILSGCISAGLFTQRWQSFILLPLAAQPIRLILPMLTAHLVKRAGPAEEGQLLSCVFALFDFGVQVGSLLLEPLWLYWSSPASASLGAPTGMASLPYIWLGVIVCVAAALGVTTIRISDGGGKLGAADLQSSEDEIGVVSADAMRQERRVAERMEF